MSRDILAPPLMRMAPNRCYRVNLIHEDFRNQHSGSTGAQQLSQTSNKGYTEDDIYGEDYNDEMDAEAECQIEENSNGTVKLEMHVAPAFYGGLIGQKGATKRRIESEAQCEMIIPQRNVIQNSANSTIVLKGKARSNVLAARRKINILLDSLRKKKRPTHFYGVALNTGVVKEKFMELRKQILDAELPGINESLFQSENCIHLTFGTCVLMDDVERKQAIEILQSCREFVNKLKLPLTVRVSGLEIMNDDPSCVRVLYAAVESEELQEFANSCFHRFNQSGLASNKNECETIKLHMTIMNSRYQTSNLGSFDARSILKQWSDFDFGTIQCNELFLCVLGDLSRSKEDFYKITGVLKF